ncbi:pilus assembly protein PilP [Desulfobulbus sp. US1]|nr:pilus assembly protein PilP [Desulfobulbus sp. US4]MCW5204769.1 pilus assembly protein PilP [Desulfobulbus sp. N2]MCW5207111.1 pilus assembly protein PilP [Desulfobulbus sp. US2]MCW5208955.1 pilus assembly protein PilP [Desulfobulbus sp. US1]
MKLIVKRHLAALLMLFVVAGLLNGGVIWAAEGDIISENKQELREVDKFQYKFEDRPDPFFPFLTKENGSRDEIDDTPIDNRKGESLTGMQLFEPGQLRLVALLKIGDRNVAMVEDVAGKGYRLDENMRIGRHGTINRITDEQIEITEKYTTKTGRVVTKEIIMRLKKEGDK